MKRKALFEAFSYVDDRYLDMVDFSEKETEPTKHKHYTLRKTVSLLIAAAICCSMLTITAVAAGWVPSIFNALKEILPQDAELFDTAAQANADSEPEVMDIPHLDLSQFVLLEQYFNGETILIGYNLDVVLPEPVIGIEPDSELMKKIQNGSNFTSTSWSDAENWITEPVTKNAIKYSLSTDAAEMDRMLKGTLSETAYQKVWELMEQQGYVCIAVRNASLGDHLLINGVDTIEAYMESNAYSNRTDYTTELGNCIRLEPLPEDVANQDQITVTLNVRSSVNYWYMTMTGEGRIYYDNGSTTTDQISFELKKVK